MSKYIKIFSVLVIAVAIASCTKLNESLNGTVTNSEAANALGANGVQLLLAAAYNDVGNPYSDMGNVFALEEVTSDECLIPTRASDWDDNGKWRALHFHTWTIDGVDIFAAMFNALNKINFDATNVLTFKPNANQAAQARFIRALSLYQLLDLYGQFPFRNPGDNLLNAPKVYRGDSAVQFIISELTTILPDLDSTNSITVASQDAAKALLIKLYLNHGSLVTPLAPTFAAADMQKVIDLGNSIINSGKYSYMSNYFYNWDVTRGGASSTEALFSIPNKSGVTTNNSGINNRWFGTLHYNQWDQIPTAAGWNGFSTVASTYNMFSLTGSTTKTPADTALDSRLGGRYYLGVTNISGLRPGILIGQQYDEHGNPLKDRKGNPLAFTTNIAPSLKETGSNLEVTGLRGIKYPPDYSSLAAYQGAGGNWCVVLRYSDVALEVAEAKLRTGDEAGALAIVNALRTARKADPMGSITLVNPANVYDPTTLLAERGRELWWEQQRRTDLIRFGVFLKPWEYKTTEASDGHFILFPIPTASLASNPNLIQNPGY